MRPKKLHIAAVVAVALLTLLVSKLALYPVVVDQISMAPSLDPGQRLFVNRLAYVLGGPDRGDVIVFRQPGEDPSVLLIKRIVGLPGETVRIHSGVVHIDERPLDEPYLGSRSASTQPDMDEFVVPQHGYFVLGDNRRHSADSRDGWTASEDAIVGRAWVAVWPFDKWGLSPNYVHADSHADPALDAETSLRVQ